MKKVLSILILGVVLATPILALAQEEVPGGLAPCTMVHDVKGCTANMPDPESPGDVTNCQKGGECNIEACCLLDRVYTIADWIFVILLVVAALFIIWGAFGFVLSGGDPEKVTAARNKLIWALVGVIVAFISRGLVRIVTQIIKK